MDNELFFLRLAQRVVHLLTVHTPAGRLYEVDVRLRPSGKGGLAFTPMHAFGAYQRNEAWTWEHQALLHSRWVAGDATVGAEFERIRREVLAGSVRRETLREDIMAMRERMRAEHARAHDGLFDLKQDRGGIADIEFLAQYWVLRHVREYPPLAEFADTIRHLESVGSAALVDHRVVDRLADAYRRYREAAHHLSLEQRPAVVEEGPFAALRADVAAIWERVMVAGAEPGAAIIPAHAARHPAERAESLRGHRRRPAIVLSDAGDVAVEQPSAGLPADRADGPGPLPVLQRRVRAQALKPDDPAARHRPRRDPV